MSSFIFSPSGGSFGYNPNQFTWNGNNLRSNSNPGTTSIAKGDSGANAFYKENIYAPVKKYLESRIQYQFENDHNWAALIDVFGLTVLPENLPEFALMFIGGFELKGITKGITVLGKTPDYRILAKEINANSFYIPYEVWTVMTDVERWIANQKFLDLAIQRGDEIILSNPVKNINDEVGFFRKELNYMIYEKGYKLSNDGSRLIK